MRRSLRKIRKTEQTITEDHPIKHTKTILNLTQNLPSPILPNPKRPQKSTQLHRLPNSYHTIPHTLPHQIPTVSPKPQPQPHPTLKQTLHKLCTECPVILEYIGQHQIGEDCVMYVVDVVARKCEEEQRKGMVGEEELVGVLLGVLRRKVGVVQCGVVCRKKEMQISALFDQRIEKLQKLINPT